MIIDMYIYFYVVSGKLKKFFDACFCKVAYHFVKHTHSVVPVFLFLFFAGGLIC